jgi:DMSO/TMAO reductase YedYZ heme-binding membrane subunit
MEFNVYKSSININISVPLAGSILLVFAGYLLFKDIGLSDLARSYAPPGQSLYVLSKVTAILVYMLMWWQILLGVFKKVNTKYHALSGMTLLFLIVFHATLFITAVSIRQGELHLGMLLPDFTAGYYKTGLSLGVIGFYLLVIATIASTLRSRFRQSWRYGHSLVYFTFALATIHGLMIGSDINSGLFSYIVYGAVLSLTIAFAYQKLISSSN